MNRFQKILYPAILIIFFAFTFQSMPPSGWYQQNITGVGSRQISDIFFLDSLTGWAVTPYVIQNDTAFVFKTTNGGDNWFKANTRIGQFVGYNKIKFLNQNTGFSCGVSQLSGFKGLSKTTDGGYNWISLNVPDPTQTNDDMFILNEDTIWLVASSSITGGVFRTTNGGLNWTQQLNLGSQNPNKIYMYNARIGFISEAMFPPNNNLRKTTNGGINWFLVTNDYFFDMHFIDSLTGWKASGNSGDSSMKKTTDGGLTWTKQILPSGGGILFSYMSSFSNINKDTIWGVGGGFIFYPNSQSKTILYRTTNGGTNWYFQLPDTSLKFNGGKIDFVNKNCGWVYSASTGIHTKVGGDTSFYLTSTENISTIIPKDYYLFQNYPNPFNPSTKISFSVKRQTSNVKLLVFDITGKYISELTNQSFNPGEYTIDFNGNNLSSGTYFYSLLIDNNLIDTKKMLLLK